MAVATTVFVVIVATDVVTVTATIVMSVCTVLVIAATYAVAVVVTGAATIVIDATNVLVVIDAIAVVVVLIIIRPILRLFESGLCKTTKGIFFSLTKLASLQITAVITSPLRLSIGHIKSTEAFIFKTQQKQHFTLVALT